MRFPIIDGDRTTWEAEARRERITTNLWKIAFLALLVGFGAAACGLVRARVEIARLRGE